MRTRLQIDIERRSPRLLAGLLNRQNLGVFDACIGMAAVPYSHAAGVDQHCAHIRIGRSQSDARPRQVKRLAEELLVSFAGSGHVGLVNCFSP